MTPYTYRLSPEERQIYIMAELVLSNNYVTMQNIAEELYVSRITIVNDMEDIKEKFKKHGISLVLDSGKGMLLICGEEEKTALLMGVFRKAKINVKNSTYFQRLILKKANIRYSFSSISAHVQNYFHKNDLVFANEGIYDIVLYIFTVFNLMGEKGIQTGANIPLSGIENMLLYVGDMLGVAVTQTMKLNFQKFLKEHSLEASVQSIDEIELYKVILNFVRKIDEETNLSLTDDEKLLTSLLTHIKSMKDWGNYEVEFPDSAETSIDYAYWQELVDKYVYILENFLNYTLNDNMKNSIIIHFCVAIIRNRKYRPLITVVVVCPGSVVAGKYLTVQVKNYFDFNIADVITEYDEENFDSAIKDQQADIDFIISTVALNTEKYKVVRVHHFLEMEDLNQIQKMTFGKIPARTQSIQHKVELLKQSVRNIFGDEELTETIIRNAENVIEEHREKLLENRDSEWKDIFDSSRIIIEEGETTWQEAMYLSAEPMEDQGYITKDYIGNAIRKVYEYGDYMMVSEGVALAHASKDEDVIRDGLSLLVSKKGITLPKSGAKIYLLFCFASTGERDYYGLLRNIIMIGRTEGKVEEIRNSETPEEVYHKTVLKQE
ncbi:MAG: PTS sugar transporter subunit IIA [Clostridiales bacterium]|nr:PTS sugar transporter subunit IIA [Clostridiales bacterium]